jgi:hypothetical protein
MGGGQIVIPALDSVKNAEEDHDVLYLPRELYGLPPEQSRSYRKGEENKNLKSMEFIPEPASPDANKKTFYPYRELRSDAEYQKIAIRVTKGRALPKKEVLLKKLEWNNKVKDSQQKLLNTLGNQTFTKLLETTKEWQKKTKKSPIIIKRRKVEHIQTDPNLEEDVEVQIQEDNNQSSPPRFKTEGSSPDEAFKDTFTTTTKPKAYITWNPSLTTSPQKSSSTGALKTEVSDTKTGRSAFLSPRAAKSIKGVTHSIMNAVAFMASDMKVETFHADLPYTYDERLNKEKDIKMVWYPRQKNSTNNGFYVDSKEGRSCVIVENVCFLYGGYNPCIDSINFQGFDIRTNTMFEVKPKNRDPAHRAFHTCCVYQHNIVFFGGEVFNRYSGSRLLTNELLVYDTIKEEFRKPGMSVLTEAKKHHAACMLGPHLVITGGQDEENRVSDAILTFNIVSTETKGWKKAPHRIQWTGLMNHSMTAIYTNTPSRLITSTSRQRQFAGLPLEQNKVLLEGIYIFGGIRSNGEYSNNLMIINTASDPWLPFSAEPVGAGPGPRADHSAHFISSHPYLVIYGGRDPNQFELTGGMALSQIYALDLTYLVWNRVNVSNCEQVARYAFNSFAIGSS